MKRIAIYAFYDPKGDVKEYVLYKLERLRAHVDEIIVICNGEPSPTGRANLQRVADSVHVRENQGFDAWAYRHGILEIVGLEKLARYDELLLLNATVYAPIFPFSELFGKMDRMNVDFWGITAFNGPVADYIPGKGIIPFHIQSYFTAIRRRLLSSQDFRDYWLTLPPLPDYFSAVLEHECRFTDHFVNRGYRAGVYSETAGLGAPNPPMDMMDVLLANRCPILKRRFFLDDAEGVHASNIDLRRALDIITRTSDYPTALIWHDVTRVARPRNLQATATLLDVLPVDGSPSLPAARPRIAVLAHVDDPAMLPALASYWCHIPIDHDLFITTCSSENEALLQAALTTTTAPLRNRLDIRVVPDRGGDISALLVGQRDILIGGSYDLVCRVHGGHPRHHGVAATRRIEEHLLGNLLGSSDYVRRVLDLFACEPCLGIAMPPPLRTGPDAFGRGWGSHKPAALALASSMKIDVPFDEYSPPLASGSMFWARPAALRVLTMHDFDWADFPKGESAADGGLPRILEQLMAYASHQAGYYSKCVMTPQCAANNYVSLEFRLDKELGQSIKRSEHDRQSRFPWAQLERYFESRLPPSSMSLRVLKSLARGARRVARTMLPNRMR